jgi:hypothetical protein
MDSGSASRIPNLNRPSGSIPYSSLVGSERYAAVLPHSAFSHSPTAEFDRSWPDPGSLVARNGAKDPLRGGS